MPAMRCVIASALVLASPNGGRARRDEALRWRARRRRLHRPERERRLGQAQERRRRLARLRLGARRRPPGRAVLFVPAQRAARLGGEPAGRHRSRCPVPAPRRSRVLRGHPRDERNLPRRGPGCDAALAEPRRPLVRAATVDQRRARPAVDAVATAPCAASCAATSRSSAAAACSSARAAPASSRSAATRCCRSRRCSASRTPPDPAQLLADLVGLLALALCEACIPVFACVLLFA